MRIPLITALLLAGCATPSVDPRAVSSSGLVGCAPADIEITEKTSTFTSMAWTARCAGKTFHCVNDPGLSLASKVACTEAR